MSYSIVDVDNTHFIQNLARLLDNPEIMTLFARVEDEALEGLHRANDEEEVLRAHREWKTINSLRTRVERLAQHNTIKGNA